MVRKIQSITDANVKLKCIQKHVVIFSWLNFGRYLPKEKNEYWMNFKSKIVNLSLMVKVIIFIRLVDISFEIHWAQRETLNLVK